MAKQTFNFEYILTICRLPWLTVLCEISLIGISFGPQTYKVTSIDIYKDFFF